MSMFLVPFPQVCLHSCAAFAVTFMIECFAVTLHIYCAVYESEITAVVYDSLSDEVAGTGPDTSENVVLWGFQ